MTSLIQQNASANIYVPEQFAMSLLVFCVIQYISNTHTYTLYVYIYLLYIVNICKYNIYEYNHRYIHISIYIYLAYMCHRNICIYIIEYDVFITCICCRCASAYLSSKPTCSKYVLHNWHWFPFLDLSLESF